MNKEDVKKMICTAIDNIPDCAEITIACVDHGYASFEAEIRVFVKVKERTRENQLKFHNTAHDAFESGLELWS